MSDQHRSAYLGELNRIIEGYVGKFKTDKDRETALRTYDKIFSQQLDLEDYLRERIAPLEGPITSEIEAIQNPHQRYFARLPPEARPISLKMALRLQRGHIVRIRYDRMIILQFIALRGDLFREREDEKLPRPGLRYEILSIAKPKEPTALGDKYNYGIHVRLGRMNPATFQVVDLGGLYGVSWLANEEPALKW